MEKVKLREHSVDEVIGEIDSSRNDILFIACPNYEERSLSALEHLLLRCHPASRQGILQVNLLTLQAKMNQNVVLDKIKQAHVEKAQKYLRDFEQAGFTWKQHTVTYPQDFYYGQLNAVLRGWISSLTSPLTVYLDISGLPRKVILGFLKSFSRLAAKEAVSRIVFIYTWPLRYPQVGRPANVGTLQVGLDGVNLVDYCNGISDVVGVVVIGRESYGATIFANTLPQNARLETYVFMSKNDPMASLRTIYSNSAFLSYISNNSNSNPHYFLSIPRGHRLLIDHARQILDEWKQLPTDKSRGYLIAALGPKPILVSGYIATQVITGSGSDRQAGVVLVSGHQYSDLYSLGFSHISCYELNLKELENSDDDDQSV
ncbi:MAG: hypothetical protein ACYDBJ_18405 [Aggregatilineales bacterium]